MLSTQRVPNHPKRRPVTHDSHRPLARVPSIDRILALPAVAALVREHGRGIVREAARSAAAATCAASWSAASPCAPWNR